MVQVVFVHGVNTRNDEFYRRELRMRDDLFERAVFPGTPFAVTNPYWGDHASNQAWKGASLPQDPMPKSFGPNTQAPMPDPARPVLASVGYAELVDALFASLVEERERDGNLLDHDELQQFKAAGSACRQTPGWFNIDMSDAVLIAKLTSEFRVAVAGATQLPLGSPVASALAALTKRIARGASTIGAAQIRSRRGETISRLIGDAFVYLKAGQRREAIRAVVVDALNTAFLAAKVANEKLVVIAHSFGGVIVHDLCSSADASLNKGFAIDLLVTVGSQPGLFEELKLFDGSDPTIPSSETTKAPRPVAIRDWINVFDKTDLLGFRAEPIFEGCTDFGFASAAALTGAHTAYFKSPQFYDRLAARLRERKIIP